MWRTGRIETGRYKWICFNSKAIFWWGEECLAEYLVHSRNIADNYNSFTPQTLRPYCVPPTYHPSLVQIKVGPYSQFSSVAQSCPTLRPHELQHPRPPCPSPTPAKFTQTHVHRGGDAIQPSHPLSPSSSPAPNPSQHQSLFQWVNSLHKVAKVLEFQL